MYPRFCTFFSYGSTTQIYRGGATLLLEGAWAPPSQRAPPTNSKKLPKTKKKKKKKKKKYNFYPYSLKNL